MGYCKIQWQQNSIASPDPFQLDTVTTGTAIAEGGATPAAVTLCVLAHVVIPDGSDNGVTALNSVFSAWPFQNLWCGALLGYTGIAAPLAPVSTIVCKSILTR